MAQQTAVEWLESQLDFLDKYMSEKDRIYLFEQAKQIEKEQIMQSYNNGKSAVIHIEENKSLEQYYNETYKQNENTTI